MDVFFAHKKLYVSYTWKENRNHSFVFLPPPISVEAYATDFLSYKGW